MSNSIHNNPLARPISITELEEVTREYVRQNIFAKLDEKMREVSVRFLFTPHNGGLREVNVMLNQSSSPFPNNSTPLSDELKELLKNVRYKESEVVNISVPPPTPLEKVKYLADKLNGTLL